MVDVKCPLCGEIYRGLNLDETDGWFICKKYNVDVKLPKYEKTCKVAFYTMETFTEECKRKTK